MFGRLLGRRKSRQVIAALGEGDRFCKDCKWCRPVVRLLVFQKYEFAKCANPKWSRPPEATKEERARYYVDEFQPPRKITESYCTIMRREDFAYCGSKGVGWESK